ncbi:MAG: molybdopterin cofactor-binding domain-containing protein [Thermodesulfobacteriota bacterium]
MTASDRKDTSKGGISAYSSPLSRRQFLKRMGILGGGIIIYFTTGRSVLWARTGRNANIPTDFNAFLRIGADEKITCLTGKIEMGQGPVTSLPQMLAEELDAPYAAVNIIMGDTAQCPWDMGTWGSLTTRQFGPLLREAAAEAKGVLKELAAEHLKSPLERLQTKDGTVFDITAPRKRVTYGELAKGKIIEKYLKDLPALKATADFSIMGKSYLRRDAREKVTGKAHYAGDIRLPGMKYARILRPPAHGAKLHNVDLSAAQKLSGAQIVRDGDLIAVLHELPDEAEKALAAVKAEFSQPRTGIDDKSIFSHLLRSAPAPEIESAAGDLQTGEKLAVKVFEETYLNSYVAHAPMEPHTALASVEGNKATVWVSTQSPFGDKERVARALNLPSENVRIITPFVGGGFGGKSGNPQAVEAAQLSRLAKCPVQVAWSRGEEFFYDTFRPAAIVTIKSGIDKGGKMVLWDYHVYFAGNRGAEQYYDIPHHREAVHGHWGRGGRGHHPFAVGPWRAPANNTNTYARELHINLMAAGAGIDPLAFRLKNLKDQRMIRTLTAAARQFGWRAQKAPAGRGYGIACGIDAGTYVALMAEVDVDQTTGNIGVKRVVCAQDMGFVVNPEGARIQMEGCVTMGLGYALREEVRFRNGEIMDLNFDTYEIPRFSWLPKIETVIVKNDELSPQGGGEPAIICMGAVIATAVHDATGAKPMQLPMTQARLKEALAKA